jgi:D-threo-aldose 1-dehydrogenase
VPSPDSTYDYLPVPPERLQRAARIAAVCDRHGTSLAAAAIRFVADQPLIATVLIGARDAREIVDDVDLLASPIAEALWSELRAEGLIPDH